MRSELPLDELPAWVGDEREPDVGIRLGNVRPSAGGKDSFGPAIRYSDTAFSLEVPAVARYLLEGGLRVIVDPAPSVDPAEVRTFLLGTVLSALCYRRGRVPLHAAALDVGGRALLLAGSSGIGKSTLAAELATRGYRLMSDDVCALDASRAGLPLVWPSFPRLKLWEDAAERLQIPTAGLERVRPELRKYSTPVGGFQPEPLAPAHLVLLQRALRPSEEIVERLTGVDAISRPSIVHRRTLGAALGCQPMVFSALGALLRTTPMTLVARMQDASRISSLADCVLELSQAPVA